MKTLQNMHFKLKEGSTYSFFRERKKREMKSESNETTNGRTKTN
jgi:hypothetical protein